MIPSMARKHATLETKLKRAGYFVDDPYERLDSPRNDLFQLRQSAVDCIRQGASSLPGEARELLVDRALRALVHGEQVSEDDPRLHPFHTWRWPELEQELVAVGMPWPGPTCLLDPALGRKLRLLVRLESEASETLEEWAAHVEEHTPLAELCRRAGLRDPSSPVGHVRTKLGAMRLRPDLRPHYQATYDGIRHRTAHRARVKRQGLEARASGTHVQMLERYVRRRINALVGGASGISFAPETVSSLGAAVGRLVKAEEPFPLEGLARQAHQYAVATSGNADLVDLFTGIVDEQLRALATELERGDVTSAIAPLMGDRCQAPTPCRRCAERSVATAFTSPPPFSPLCECNEVDWFRGNRQLNKEWYLLLRHWALIRYCGRHEPARWMSPLRSADQWSRERSGPTSHQAPSTATPTSTGVFVPTSEDLEVARFSSYERL
jgi:hypothetical protein